MPWTGWKGDTASGMNATNASRVSFATSSPPERGESSCGAKSIADSSTVRDVKNTKGPGLRKDGRSSLKSE